MLNEYLVKELKEIDVIGYYEDGVLVGGDNENGQLIRYWSCGCRIQSTRNSDQFSEHLEFYLY